MAMAEAGRSQNAGPKLGRPITKQMTFHWNSTGKYAELRIFRLEVNNMFQNYRISQAERVLIIKNWQGRQGLQLLEFLPQAKQETCNTEECLFEMLNKFKPQYHKTIKFLQFHKLMRQANGNTEDRQNQSGGQSVITELDRQLKEQFMHRLDNSDKLAEIIRELTKTNENTLVTSEQVLVLAKGIEAHRSQAAVIHGL